MDARNMLGAQKVRLHGMTSAKWTTKDKITQYKGLINLYTRDKKLIEADTLIEQKKQVKEIKKLRKEIDQNRKDLDNAISGDKQKLRNTLAEHREMQLAYQNSQPEKVIEQVHQMNFNKRKKRDMLKYRMNMKSEQLIDLKLKYAEYEDRLKLEHLAWSHALPCEKLAHIITGKVQDAILKKEAAIYIKNSYKHMISIMKKDAIYFDAILVTIHKDGLQQAKCMINATKLGQLGTEYLDDRRQEFEALDKLVKENLIQRRKDLKTVQENVENFALNLRDLIRRDSDINVGKMELPITESFMQLKTEYEEIKTTLIFLKDSIFTPTVEAIFPCIREQVRQKERLQEFVEKFEKNKDDLIKRNNHAKSSYSTLKNTMIDTTTQYVNEKKELNEKIEEENLKIKELNELIKNRYTLMANIVNALKTLQLLANLLNDPKQPAVVTKRSKIDSSPGCLVTLNQETDGKKILPELITKFTRLIANNKEPLTGTDLEHGYQAFECMVDTFHEEMPLQIEVSEETLMESMFADAHVLSRDDIKKQSEEIVAANAVSDDFVPLPQAKKFKRK